MIGIDLVENERIKKAMQSSVFLTKILNAKEIEYVNSFKNNVEHIAGFFSAKEAVMKALKDCKQIGFKDIEIFHTENGSPYVMLYGKAKEIFDQLGYSRIEVSISQTQNFATAICTLIN